MKALTPPLIGWDAKPGNTRCLIDKVVKLLPDGEFSDQRRRPLFFRERLIANVIGAERISCAIWEASWGFLIDNGVKNLANLDPMRCQL